MTCLKACADFPPVILQPIPPNLITINTTTKPPSLTTTTTTKPSLKVILINFLMNV